MVEGNPEPTSDAGTHWSDSYPETKGNPTFQKFESPAALAKSYGELESKIGAKGVIVPGPKASAEEIARFRQQIGTPDDIRGYTEGFEKPSWGWDDNVAMKLLAAVHQENLPKASGQRLLGRYKDIVSEQMAEVEALRADAGRRAAETLREKWGSAYDKNIAKAGEAGRALWGDDGWKALRNTFLGDGTLLGDHAPFAEAMAKLGETLGEAELFGVQPSSGGAALEPAAAQAEIQRLMADPAFKNAYLDSNAPDHANAVARMSALYEMAHRSAA